MRRIWFFILVALATSCSLQTTHVAARDSAGDPPAAPATPSGPPARSTVGNGTDYFSRDHGSAWFLGEQPIRYCVQQSSDFGVGKNFAKDAIELAFESWQHYLVKLRVNDSRFHPERNLQPKDPALTMKAAAMPACDGTQDLTFYLGVQNEEVKSYLPYYHRPFAFSERTAYDVETGRGKGFIWLARDGLYGFQKPEYEYGYSSLDSLILHELGHVAGCGHVRNTIMDENLALSLNSAIDHSTLLKYGNEAQFSRIDYWSFAGNEGLRTLLYCPECDYKASWWYKVDDKSLWETLTGTALPAGMDYRIRLESKEELVKSVPFKLAGWKQDNRAGADYSKTFTIDSLTSIAHYHGEPVFRIVFQRGDQTVVSSSSSGAEVFQGTVATASGKQIPVLVKWNSDSEPLVIDHVDLQGVSHRLFELDTVLESNGITL